MNNTLFLSQTPDEDPSDQPQGEAKMREALGLRTNGTRITPSTNRPDRQPDHGPNAARRHRFVQEGEVPVEVMTLRDHGSRAPGGLAGNPRHRVDETAVLAEKMAREQAERACSDLSERLREVQTKLGHAELARDEALALAARRQVQLDTLLAQPAPPPPAPPAPDPMRSAPLPQFSLTLDQPSEAVAAVIATPRKLSKPRGRARVKAPQPVKWWIKAAPAPE